MSPGGSSGQLRDELGVLPPLSNIVTTAFGEIQGLRFNPPSKLGRPVPPPKHPTLISRKRIRTELYQPPDSNAPGRERLRNW
jgi:hypothetical protein